MKLEISSRGDRLIATILVTLVLALSANAQTGTPGGEKNDATPTEMVAANSRKQPAPVVAVLPFKDGYKQVKLGAMADGVEDILGKPKFKDDTALLYDFGGDETLQINLGPEKDVTTIAAIFTDAKKAPTFTDVFGADAKPETRSDGSLYKLVRYPEAGYWVSYFKGTGDSATVAVTIQKL